MDPRSDSRVDPQTTRRTTRSDRIEIKGPSTINKKFQRRRSEWGSLAAKAAPHEAKCLFRMEGSFFGSWIK